ncbi:disulfide bond formation protein B [Bauldia sp.]|uniref:disulfide bond formation protein B n=1 Tax=Bauldia sp. TaxID=2575872 RepID=UPI003BAA76F7
MDATHRREMLAPAIVLVVGGSALATAWGFQLIGGFIPCELCLQQRVPYYIGLPIALAALLAAVAGAKPTAVRMLMMVAGLIFVFNVYLGVYHAGAEWAWWPGPADCGAGGAGPVGDVNDLLGQLDSIRIVSCTDATWRFLGLSFAGWNVVASLVLVAVAFWGAFRRLAEPSTVPARSEA